MATENKPSNNEEEYFKREDAERLRKLHAEELSRMKQSERDALKAQHAGRCSNCGALMVPERIAGATILHCPACGGAFLDRGTWEFIHAHVEPHSVMASVLNWFKAANKP
jgi:ribosomal protein L32